MFNKSSQWVRRLGLALMLVLVLFAQQAVAQESTNEIEIVGFIEAMNRATITVNGLTVNISDAELNAPLQLGLAVKVEGTLQSGVISAREVTAAESGILPDEVEIVGVLERFDGQIMVINGQTIDVSTAEFENMPVVGEIVKVHIANFGAASVWVAREVETFSPDDGPNDDMDDQNDDSSDLSDADGLREGEFELTGTLTEVGDGFVVVSGQTINVAGAEVKSPLVVGALVKLHLRITDDGWAAREVELSRGDDDEDDDSHNRGSRDDDQDDAMSDDSGSSGGSDDNSGPGSSDDHSASDNSGHDGSDDDRDDDHSDNSGHDDDDDRNDNGDDHGGNHDDESDDD